MIITPLPLTTYTAGTHLLSPASIPLNLVFAKARFDLTHLTALTLVMDISLEISQDNGATWTFAGGSGLNLPNSGFTLNGGVITNSAGQVITQSGISVSLPQPANNQRQIRGTINLTEDFLTQITLELL